MVYQLSTILDDVSSTIQKLYKSKSTNLHGNKYSPKSLVKKKYSPKSCSPQSNINSCKSTSKKLSYNQHDHGIEVSNIIFNISDEDDAVNTTSKIPNVHPSDNSYCTQKQHMSHFKCTKASTLCTPPKQMKKVSPKSISRRTRQGVLTLFLNV